MPIRHENKARYPKNWPAISKRIRSAASRQTDNADEGQMKMPKLDWSDYKSSDTGSRTVFFPGGFQLVVMNHHPKNWVPTKQWRVWWGDQGPPIKGLSDRLFKTQDAAIRAAEHVFFPMVEIAPKLVDHDIKIVVAGVLAPKPKRRRNASR